MLKENISHKATHNILCIDKTFFKLLFARITQLYREKETIIMAQLLIEIFTEELPALPLLKNLDSIQENWANILKTNDLTSEFSFFYTPRRLTIVHRDFALQQPNKKIQIYGPPIHIAYDENKKPSKALQSFLQKNDITLNDIKIITKNNKEVVLYEKNENGVKSIEILGNMVQSWLMSLNFGKSMRWGNHEESFIRPIRNICILLDSNLVPCHAYGLHTSNNITAHRQAKNNQKTVTNLQSYMSFLANNGVIIDQAIRKNSIIESIQKLEKQHNIQVEIDNDLLDEIVAITEYPTALFGHFDKRFLQIPKEMIITSMKENQRYFAIYKDSQLYNGFIVISNTFGGNLELITKGNEKVLKARLSDAEFFYHNDLKARMQFGNLGDISFMQGAGSLADKIQREIVLAQYIIDSKDTVRGAAKKFGVKNVTFIGYLLFFIGSGMGLLDPSNLPLALVAGFIRQIGQLPNAYVFATLICFAYDHIEFKNGFRVEGLLGMLILFGLQTACAAPFAGGYESSLLQMGFTDVEGYLPPENIVNFMGFCFYGVDFIVSIAFLILCFTLFSNS